MGINLGQLCISLTLLPQESGLAALSKIGRDTREFCVVISFHIILCCAKVETIFFKPKALYCIFDLITNF